MVAKLSIMGIDRLFKQFAQFPAQSLSPQSFRDNFAFRINKDIIWDPVKAKCLYSFTVPVSEVADMCPAQFVFVNGFDPRIFALVKGNAYDREILCFETYRLNELTYL